MDAPTSQPWPVASTVIVSAAWSMLAACIVGLGVQAEAWPVMAAAGVMGICLVLAQIIGDRW